MASISQPAPPYITAQGRDLRVDLLRGYFVFAMVVDHVRGASPLWFITGGNRFFVGAAEGFILTSGLVAGIVYSRLIKRDGMGSSFVRVLRRAFTLYQLTMALSLVFLPLSELLDLPWAQGVDARSPISLLVSILMLHRTYYLVDVMLLYTVLFLLTPLALVLIDQGKRWWVLGASWLLWGLYQIWPQYAALPWPIAGNYVFNFSAWQVFYFTGLVFGYGRAAMPIPSPRTARRLLALSGILLALLIVLFYVIEPPVGATPDQFVATSGAGRDLRVFVEDMFLNKVSERPGRLLAAAITFTFLFLATTVFWEHVHRAIGWLFLPLGQHALYAYTAHVGLVAVIAIIMTPFKLGNPGPQWLNALIQAASIALIWLGVRFQFLSPTPRTQRLYNLAPVFFAMFALAVFYLDPSPAYPGLAEPTVVARRVSRFGTPLPPDTGKPKAAAQGTPIPEPTLAPETRPPDPSWALERVDPWLGEIVGTLEERWFYSEILEREMPYWAYLPPDYKLGGRRYPVIYMLHGRGGHRDEWIHYTLVDVADREMSHGVLPPMIIIMPQGDRGFWVNNVGNGLRWGDYVVQELVPEVDGTYRTLRSPASRAIGGLSMGGFGALTLAFTHPDVFGVVGAHTPSLRAEAEDIAFLGTGDEYAQRDPLVLAKTAPDVERVRIWIDIDEADPWLDRAKELHEILKARKVDHIFQILPGIHNYEYWSTHVIDYLHFYGDALRVTRGRSR